MATQARRVAVSFTGGKDSTLVLHLLKLGVEGLNAAVQEHVAPYGACDVVLLVTFVPAGGQQSFKAHPLNIIELQCQALGIEHKVCEISAPFLESYRQHIKQLGQDHGIEALVTGDILDVCNRFMFRACENTGVELWTPLWDIDRKLLLDLLWHFKMEAMVSCVNISKFGSQVGIDAAGQKDNPVCGVAPAIKQTSKEQAANATQQVRQSEAIDNQLVIVNGHTTSSAVATESVATTNQPDNESTSAASVSSASVCAEAVAISSVVCSTFDCDQPVQPVTDLLGHTLTPLLYDSVLLQSHRMHGVDVCGEMGEYHTVVADCQLMKRRLQLAATKQTEGDYAFLLYSNACLSDKLVHAKS